MQQRQSPSVEVTASRSNDGEISAPSLPRNESGILQQKMDSAIESSDSGLSKVCTVSDDLSNADVEKPISGFGNISMSKSKSLATDSSQTSLLPDKVPNADSHKKLIPGNRNDGRLNVVFATPKKELDEPIVSPNARGHLSTSCMKEIPESGVQVSQFNQVSIVTKRDQDDSEPGQSPDTGRNPSTACAEGESDSVEHEKSLMVVHSTNTPIPTSSSDQEKMIYSGRPEKTVYKLQPRRNPDSAAHASQLEQEINSSRGREKALDDGYNWRKYGQKFVKGNVLVRSYYKCTFSNCRAKKQVERCHDGRLTDIKYIGRHEHPKPHSPQIPAVVTPLQAFKVDTPIATMSEEPSTPNAETSQSIEPAQSPRELTATENNNSLAVSIPLLHNPRDDDDSSSSNPKKQKRETASIDDNQVKKTYCDSRQVVQMMSEVDIVNDGYRWRKYGQKLVKGNPNPRSYYRCSSAGCTVKKHVERASHDPKVVITTYEGNHDHDMPASRTVVQSAAESGIKGATLNGENRSELGEPNQVGMEMVVRIGAN